MHYLEPKKKVNRRKEQCLTDHLHRELSIVSKNYLLLFEKIKSNHPLITIVVSKELSHRDEKCAPIGNPFHCRIFPIGRLEYWPYGRNIFVHPFEPLFTAPTIAQIVITLSLTKIL
jgi:hypothetical protein